MVGFWVANFFSAQGPKFCYEKRTVILNTENCEIMGKAQPLKTNGMQITKTGQIKSPPRTVSIVRVPVASGSPQIGMINKSELHEGRHFSSVIN